MLFEIWFLLLYLFCNVELELIYFIQLVSQHQKTPKILN